MSKETIDWMTFLLGTVDAVSEPLGVVLSAWSCREAWLQGEIYRAGRPFDLRVNQYKLGRYQKADLSCAGNPNMVGEIKVTGADYEPKMQYYIEEDARRLRELEAENTERYLLLVIPQSNRRGKFHKFLHECSFSDHCIEREYPKFTLRLWNMAPEQRLRNT